MDVGFTYLNGMVALQKFRGNASRCIESLFLPKNTDDSNFFWAAVDYRRSGYLVPQFRPGGVVIERRYDPTPTTFPIVADFNYPKNGSLLGGHLASKIGKNYSQGTKFQSMARQHEDGVGNQILVMGRSRDRERWRDGVWNQILIVVSHPIMT